MLYKRQTELLNGEVEALLARLIHAGSLHNLARESLTRVRQGSAAQSIHYNNWPLLPLIICEAISRSYEHALPAAAAFQLLRAAGDVFDDIEDADTSESLYTKYGTALATNVATTFLILAEKAMTELEERGVSDNIIVRIIDLVNSAYTTACIGQHLDLSYTSKTIALEDTYFKLAYMKSASSIESACHVGALLSTENKELINLFATFGYNLGMTSQIANDILGITRGSDIVKPKMTLPVIYALTQTNGKDYNKLEMFLTKVSERVPDTTQIKDLLFRTGAIHYSTVKMELYKQQALDKLTEAERLGVNSKLLRPFLE